MSVVREDLPGADLVITGLRDLAHGEETEAALLVSIGGPRLRRLGVLEGESIPDPEHRLYNLLSASYGDDAHNRYNSLIQRLVSFEQALECVGS